MKKNAEVSLKIHYWGCQEGPTIIPLNGIKEFEEEISDSYIATIHGRPGDLGGGLYEFAIEIVSNIELKEIGVFLGSLLAGEMIVGGSKKYLLNPLFAAYRKLKRKNKENEIDIECIKLVLRDSVVTIDKITDSGIEKYLPKILGSLKSNYENLKFKGELPFEIHIPVFKDTKMMSGKNTLFRTILMWEELEKNKTAKKYFEFWGLYYDYARQFKIYDVMKKKKMNYEYLTRERYDSEVVPKLMKKWKRKKGQ